MSIECLIRDHTILGKISKRGNKYLRTLFVQAVHVILEPRARPYLDHQQPSPARLDRCWGSERQHPVIVSRHDLDPATVSGEDRRKCLNEQGPVTFVHVS